MLYFLPIFIARMYGPKIYNLESQKTPEFNKYVLMLMSRMVFISLIISVILMLFSDSIIELIFGDKYVESSPVLKIHVWTGVFVFLSAISGRWLIAKDLQKTSMVRNLIGLLVNILLNIILIPMYGVIGGATGTIISFIVGNYVANYFNSKTKELFYMQTKSLLFFWKYSF